MALPDDLTAGQVVIKQHIIIVGFMGTGKTTVARELGQRLDCPVIDLDEVITLHEGRSPNEIILEDSESGFRQVETQTLRTVLGEDAALVIAVGGGAWTVPENRKLITARGAFTVWLDAPFELCWERIQAASEARPLAPSREDAESLYNQRYPLYELADLKVEVADGERPEEIAMKIASEVCRTQ